MTLKICGLFSVTGKNSCGNYGCIVSVLVKIEWYCPLGKCCTSDENRPGYSVRYANDMPALLPRSAIEARLTKEGLIPELGLC